MFETNEDFDLDFNDDIFGDSGTSTSQNSANLERVKRQCSQSSSGNDFKRLRPNVEEEKAKTSNIHENVGSSLLLSNKHREFLEKINRIIVSSTVTEDVITHNSNFNFKTPITPPGGNKKFVPRMFPGPAGLLSNQHNVSFDTIKADSGSSVNDTSKGQNTDEILCSQMSLAAFSSATWCQMLKDYQTSGETFLSLPDKYNIAWIKSRAASKNLIAEKAPFLSALIQNVECSDLKKPIATVVLRDPTGEIEGIIQSDLYKEYANEMTVGGVVVLKQVGVLRTNFGQKLCLTITPNNIIQIYCPQTEVNGSTADTVKVIKLQDLTAEDLHKINAEVKEQHRLNREQKRTNWNANMPKQIENSIVLPVTRISTNVIMSSPVRILRNYNENSIGPVPSVSGLGSPNVDSNSSMCNLDTARYNNKFMFKKSTQAGKHINHNTYTNCDILQSSALPKWNVTTENYKEKVSIFEDSCSSFDLSMESPKFSRYETGLHSSRRLSLNNTANSHIDANVTQCSQISIKGANSNHSEILQNVFDGVDADSFFEDF